MNKVKSLQIVVQISKESFRCVVSEPSGLIVSTPDSPASLLSVLAEMEKSFNKD